MKRFIVIMIISVIFISTCIESPTDPIPLPGSRDYTWTIDTLGRPTIDYYSRMWGSSPKDIWAVSWGSYPPNNIIHYDGKKWKAVGPFKRIMPSSVWGFSPNNVWISTGPFFWNYDGVSWTKIFEIAKDGYKYLHLGCMWGKSNMLYAFGAYPDSNLNANIPVIVQVRNKEWKFINTTGIRGIVANLFVGLNNKMYIQNIQWQDIKKRDYDSTQIYEYDGYKFNRLYSSAWNLGKTADISLINNKVYFVLGYKIAERVNNQFRTIVEIDKKNFDGMIWGRSKSDIFLGMQDGIAHYNGYDIKYLKYFKQPVTGIFKAFIFKDEVFFLVYDYSTKISLMYHGKLEKGG